MWHTARLKVLDRRIRTSCREAKAQHAAGTCSQLEEASWAHHYRTAWEHCRLLAGQSRRSVKPQAIPTEKALDPVALAAHMKKVFGATSSPAPPLTSASATLAWRSPLSDHFAGLPALRKQALKMKRRRYGRFLQSSTSFTWPERISSHLISQPLCTCSGTASLCVAYSTVTKSNIDWQTAGFLLSRKQADRAQTTCDPSTCQIRRASSSLDTGFLTCMDMLSRPLFQEIQATAECWRRFAAFTIRLECL